MNTTKTLLAAASLTAAMVVGMGAASAAPQDHHDNRHQVTRHDRDHYGMRHDFRRPIVMHDRVFQTLRQHHYRSLGNPLFVRGHYVVKVTGRFGRPLFIEVDPYTGRLIGEFRI
jgi:hypothetical protein